MSNVDELELSFSSLAARLEDTASSTTPFAGGPQGDESNPFHWSGAGQRLFNGESSTRQSPRETDNEDGDPFDENNGAPDEYCNKSFKAVIPLPDLVDVKTGEEGWELIFSERAKLYRYDRDTAEWKERGTGKIKILQNQETERFRLLMRREQVLKVVCNHLLSADTELKPLLTSEHAWCWTAVDFSETTPVTEQFAVRFKAANIAKEFKHKLDECVMKLSNLQGTDSQDY